MFNCNRRGRILRAVRRRSQATHGAMAVRFTLDFIAYCNEQDGGCETDEITKIAQVVYQQLNSKLHEAFASVGGSPSAFIAALLNAVTQSPEIKNAFQDAAVDAASFSSTINIQQILNSIVEVFLHWYPGEFNSLDQFNINLIQVQTH